MRYKSIKISEEASMAAHMMSLHSDMTQQQIISEAVIEKLKKDHPEMVEQHKIFYANRRKSGLKE